MIFRSRSQLASKQIRGTGRAEAVTKEGLAATLLPGRQPDQMGQRHSLRPVRPRSCPGPLRNGSLWAARRAGLAFEVALIQSAQSAVVDAPGGWGTTSKLLSAITAAAWPGMGPRGASSLDEDLGQEVVPGLDEVHTDRGVREGCGPSNNWLNQSVLRVTRLAIRKPWARSVRQTRSCPEQGMLESGCCLLESQQHANDIAV